MKRLDYGFLANRDHIALIEPIICQIDSGLESIGRIYVPSDSIFHSGLPYNSGIIPCRRTQIPIKTVVKARIIEGEIIENLRRKNMIPVESLGIIGEIESHIIKIELLHRHSEDIPPPERA